MDGLERIANIIKTDINKTLDKCNISPCANGEYCPYYPFSKYYQIGTPIPMCVFSHDPNNLYVPSERQKRLDNEKKNKGPGPYDHLIVDNNSNK
jgi:hypothetical protein